MLPGERNEGGSAMRSIARKWTMPPRNREAVIYQFSIEFEGRVLVRVEKTNR
jgi:hypothetical protein